VRYNAGKLETLAWEWAKRAVELGVMGALARAQEEERRAAAGDGEADLKRLRGELAAVDGEERDLLTLALKGFSPGLIEERLEPLRKRRAFLAREVTERERLLSRGTDPEVAERQAEEYAAGLREQLARLDARGGDDPEGLQGIYRELLRIALRKDGAPEIEVLLPTFRQG
jgi:hypothetical protein